MVDIKEQSPLSLAFVGDAVYSLLIREHLVTSKRYTISKLNSITVQYVSAKGQFAAMEIISPMLTEQEAAVYKRGQNSSKASVAKHASAREYRASTGFECLVGYLHLTGQYDRINQLVGEIIEKMPVNL